MDNNKKEMQDRMLSNLDTLSSYHIIVEDEIAYDIVKMIERDLNKMIEYENKDLLSKDCKTKEQRIKDNPKQEAKDGNSKEVLQNESGGSRKGRWGLLGT